MMKDNFDSFLEPIHNEEELDNILDADGID